MKFSHLALLPVLTITSACGGTTIIDNSPMQDPEPVPVIVEPVGTATENANGTYVVTQGTTVTNLPATNVNINGQKAWRTGFNGGTFNGDSYAGTDVLAIGGVTADGQPFAGISGTQTAAPTGNATFTGRYAVTQSNGSSVSGVLTMDFDLADSTLTNDGGDLGIDATVSGGEVTGLVTYDGSSAELEGGFYGTNEVAGAFNGTGLGGIIFGTR